MKKFLLPAVSNLPLLVILVVAFITRFYRLGELTTFGGDQGVDYLRVFEMISSRRPTLLGPVTHVGVYLGPLYYYMLAPFLVIFKFDPMAAPVMFALFATATAGLVYLLAESILRPGLARARPGLSKLFALLTALLYAVSPVILESSRAPSQPHLIPFFAALLLISGVRIMGGRGNKWDLAAIGISLAATIQFHFLAFPLWIFILIIMVYKGLTFADAKVRPFHQAVTPYKILWLVIPAIVLLFPWFLFELRHNFFISHQIISYLQSGEVGFSPVAYLTRILDLTWFSFDRLVGQGNQFVTAFAIVAALYGFFKVRPWRTPGSDLLTPQAIIFFYASINILGICLYSSPLSNHYISALYPVIIILTAYGIFRIFPYRLAVITFILFIIFTLGKNDFSRDHGYTMPAGVTTRTIAMAAAVIADDMGGKGGTFEVANTLDGDTRAYPYRYVLTAVHKLKPLGVEKYPEAARLYIVSREAPEKLLIDRRWELLSFPVAEATRLAEVSPGIFVIRFTAGTADRQELIEGVRSKE
jgi:hypothetical protein